MVRITIDEQLREKLLSSGEVVELCDESGKLLARVVPEKPKSYIPEGWEPVLPELSDEELQRLAESDERGISTAELVKRLRGLS